MWWLIWSPSIGYERTSLSNGKVARQWAAENNRLSYRGGTDWLAARVAIPADPRKKGPRP